MESTGKRIYSQLTYTIFIRKIKYKCIKYLEPKQSYVLHGPTQIFYLQNDTFC